MPRLWLGLGGGGVVGSHNVVLLVRSGRGDRTLPYGWKRCFVLLVRLFMLSFISDIIVTKCSIKAIKSLWVSLSIMIPST